MRVLATGVAGFVGSHVAERLLDDGHEVVGLDNLDDFYDPSVKKVNMTSLMTRPDFRFVEGDIRDANAMNESARGCEAIIHLAARPGVRPSFSFPSLYSDVNVAGTARVLEAARDQSISKVVFCSSSSVYGEGASTPFSEKGDLGVPASPYASTKVAGEMLCRNLAGDIGSVTVLRLFTVYGPRQRPDLAIHKFARKIVSGEPIQVFGPEDSFRDYTFVQDIADGIIGSLSVKDQFEIFNLGSGNPITLGQMIRELEEALDARAQREMLPPQRGDLYGTWADVGRAREALGYEPRWSFTEGVKEFAGWFIDGVDR